MSAWRDYVTSVLLGTEKAALPALPAPLAHALGGCDAMDRESGFLTCAGAVALWRRAGWKPPRNEMEIRPAEPETTRSVSRTSAAHLRAMLSEHYMAVLPEWLSEVARVRRHAPPELLPALFDRARQDRALRSLVAASGGRRAAWLATHNPDWAFVLTDAPDAWKTGSRDQRVAWLRALRAAAPAEARSRIEAVWKTEPAEVRAAFVAELAANLSDEDAPFLDAALDDRSKEVRRAAVDLLARLPSSAFTVRMIARATPLLAFKRGELFSRASLKVTLPSEFDAAATRDGLGPKPLGDRRTTLGEKAVLLVLILSAVPLRHWTDTFEQTPAGLVKAAEESEFAAELCAFPGYWPPVLATEVLSTLCRAAADGIASYLRATAESLVFHLPPVMLAGAVNALPTDNEGTAALVALSTFRHDALTALTQP